MKHTTKTLALIIAVAMFLALGVPAMADGPGEGSRDPAKATIDVRISLTGMS